MDGLRYGQGQQRDEYGVAPEVVPGTAPEYIYRGPYEVGHKILVPASESGSVEILDKPEVAPVARQSPLWKRKKLILAFIAIVVVAAGLAVGLGVGLSVRKDSASRQDAESDQSPGNGTDSRNDDNRTNLAGFCQGDLCGKVLTAVVHENTMYAIARTDDQRIAIRANNGTSWVDEFDDLDAPQGSLIGQPIAGSWRVHDSFDRLDIFVVAGSDGTVHRKFFSSAENWSTWQEVGQNVGSKLNFCTTALAMMHLWTTTQNTGEIYHTFWVQKDDKNISSEALKDGITSEHGELFNEGRPWQVEKEGEKSIASTKSGIAALCRDARFYHDVFWYDDSDHGLFYSNYNFQVGWSVPKQWKGEFIGEPTVVSFERDQERWHFFGVQKNRNLFYTTWESGEAVTRPLENLGGKILSVPAVESLKPDTMDAVALGVNGRLQHLHFNGTEWASEWEDLGIESHSAPSTVVFEDQIFILYLDSDGSMVSLARDASNPAKRWKGSLQQHTLGGKFYSDFLTSKQGS